jgi:hypothetical protein
MLRIPEPEHVARVLDYRVLEASAGAEKRQAGFAAEPDCAHGAVEAAVRAAGRTPERIEASQLGGVAVAERSRVQPPDLRPRAEGRRRVLDRSVRRRMGRELGIELTYDTDGQV